MKQTLYCILLVFALAVNGAAMMALVTDDELIGSSDLAIVGTVLEDTRLDGEGSWLTGRATVRVDRVLKGEAAGNVTVLHMMPPKPEAGIFVADHGGFTLAPNSQWVLFLQHSQGGYSMVGGMQGRREVAAEAQFAARIKGFPLEASVSMPDGPVYFGREVPVTVTLSNHGAVPVKYYRPMLECYYYSPRFGLNVMFRPVQANDSLEQAEPVVIEPNSTKQITTKYRTAVSQSWQGFTPDTYLLTPVSLRARVFVETPPPAGGDATRSRYTLATPWIDTLLGFPPPEK